MFKPEHEVKLNLQLFAEDEDDIEESDELPFDDEDIMEESEDADADETEESKEPEEEFDEITYNKEKVKIPKKDRQTYLQKGYNYDKVHEKYTATEQELKEIEFLTGMNRKQVIEALKKQQIDNQVNKYVEEYGTSEEVARREIEKDLRLKEIEAKLKMTESQTKAIEQKASYKDKPFFNELESEIDELISNTPGVDVPTAYKYIVGQYVESGKIDELKKKAAKQAEKRTIANVQDRAKRGIVKGSDNADDNFSNVKISEKGKAFADFLGFDVRDIAKHVAKRKKELNR